MTLEDLAGEIEDKGFAGLTIFKRDGRWMVSTKGEKGFRPVWGPDLTETVGRAVDDGPQSNDLLPSIDDDEDDFEDLI